MAYNIFKSNGSPVSVPDNVIDNQFYNPNFNGVGRGIGTQLVGRNAIDYGAPIAQNFLQLTENFANELPPSDATSMIGQIWFNTGTSDLYVKASINGAGIENWKKIVTIGLDDNTNIDGDLVVSGTVYSRGGRTPVVNPTGIPLDGDIRIEGETIYIYASGNWRQVFPAIYS